LLVSIASAQSASSVELPRTQTIVEEIRRLEGARDPKCHATASRLEDLIYGTPLTADARFRKNDLQRDLVLAIWAAASDKARQRGVSVIPRDVLNEARQQYLEYGTVAHGNWRVEINKQDHVINQTDKRQYATVAYALRAILAVEQEQLLGDVKFLPLSDASVEALKEAVDLFTLVALQKADRRARQANRYRLDVADIDLAWKDLAPIAGTVPAAKVAARPAGPTDYALLRQIIDQKVKSFEQYNEVSTQVFLRNLQVYFARHGWPRDPETGATFRKLFTEVMIAFSHDLLLGAEAEATKNGHVLIRASDVETFAQRFIPHRLNEYEDAIFFPRLPRAQQVEIEAYDMDSFRDGGLHWRYLQHVIDDPKLRGKVEPDPFAAELITENIAQFGVLVLRETGRLSRDHGHESLHPDVITDALKGIQARIDAHAKAPAPPPPEARIVSAGHASAPTPFVDVTELTGIHYRHRQSDWLSRRIRTYSLKSDKVGEMAIPPAFQGSGVATEDIDNDGRPDILLLGGLGNRLYKNNGDGTFTDITDRAGLGWRRPDGHPGEPRQAIVADFDNDGRQDILITYVDDKHRLYRNLGGGRFEDVTDRAGLGGDGLVGGPATALDIDGDGLLDVYIGYFGDYLKGVLPTLARRNTNALPDKLFRNKGHFRFEDVTAQSGIDSRGWAQAITHTDLDGDGRQDIIVGNDFGVNAYYRNLGGGKFENITERLNTGKPSYTMGIGIADLNRDGYPDIYVSNIVIMNKDEKYVVPGEETVMKFNPAKLANMRVVEANDLFISRARDGKVLEYEPSDLVGRGYEETGWSWGTEFFDVDNDGDDDLYVVNGTNAYNIYTRENPYYTDPAGTARNVVFPRWAGAIERNVLFVNSGGRLNVLPNSGADLHGNSRSFALLDLEGDGDLDIVLNGFGEQTVVLKNTAETLGHHWLAIRLVGDPQKRTTRDAIGARIVVTAPGGLDVWREVRSTGGYHSTNVKEQHFGVGKQRKVTVSVLWPNGERSEFKDVAADRRYVIRQGATAPTELKPARAEK
jgi:histone H3/H4